MSEQDKDRSDLSESKQALSEARKSAVKADVAVASLHQTTSEIRLIVKENGYVTRFRALLKGA